MIYCPYPDIAFWEVLDCMTVKTMCYEFSATKIRYLKTGKEAVLYWVEPIVPTQHIIKKSDVFPKDETELKNLCLEYLKADSQN